MFPNWGNGGQRGDSLSEENTPFRSPRERRGEVPSTPTLRDLDLKSCTRCAIGCLLFFVSIRFGLLLFSLPLCLRFVSLQQSPSTLDFIRLAGAYRGGIAALAASFALSVEGDYTAPTLRFESGSG